jgi:hypothetical protein
MILTNLCILISKVHLNNLQIRLLLRYQFEFCLVRAFVFHSA